MNASGAVPGRATLRIDRIGTIAFVVLGIPAVASDDVARFVFAPLSLVLAGIGVVGFVWSYFIAVERSRVDEISVTQLYLVMSDAAATPARTMLRLLLAAQVVAAITFMSVGFVNTEPKHFNWAAVAIVVPMFGLGLNGMWVARYGHFRPRILTKPAAAPKGHEGQTAVESPDSPSGMEQNSPHG